MLKSVKTSQLQIRISPEDKRRIQQAAKKANKSLSEFICERALSGLVEVSKFDKLVSALNSEVLDSFALAEMNDFLVDLSKEELETILEFPRTLGKSPLVANYLAAMLEHACQRKGVKIASWLKNVLPLQQPWFATELTSLRLHLLQNAPVPFRRRGLFVDTSLGGRV